jgi:phage terminase large subunit-like protein
LDACTQYALDVTAGKIPTGEPALWACQRHLDDLAKRADDDYLFYFDAKEAEQFRRFAGSLIQFEGDFSGQPLTLLPWQSFVFGCTYGWKRKGSNLRRFRTAYVEVPRKNGKTTCAVAPVLYALIVEKEPAAEVYALATKQDQAKKLWDACWKIVARTPGLSTRLRKRFNSVENESTFSFFKPLGADSTTLDGLNPYLAVCDELHAWKGRDLWDVIADGMGSRSQPLMFAITTAGYDQNGICYTQRTHGLNVCDPGKFEYEDDAFFCYVATVSKANEDNWESEEAWIEANPSLGVAKRLDYLESQSSEAKQIPSKRNAFLNKQLNIWTTAANHWLDLRKWDECTAEFAFDDLRGHPCFVGIDLAKVNDVSSVSYVFPPHGAHEKWRVIVRHYVPEDDIHERSKNVPYETWRDMGQIIATPGNCTDFDFIRHDMNQTAEIVDVRLVAYDRHFAHELITHLTDDGFECVGFGQGFVSMSAPTAELERMIITGEIEHAGCRVLRWMAGNAVVLMDSAGNIKPDKAKSADKIDGISATIMSIGVAMTNTVKKSVYETRGIREI